MNSPIIRPPQSIEIEQEYLGAILNNDAALRASHTLISASDFSELLHGRMFACILQIHESGEAVTPRLLCAQLGSVATETLGPINVAEYVARLAAEAAIPANAPSYAKQIRNLADRRRLIALGNTLAVRAADDGCAASLLASECIDHLDAVATNATPEHTRASSVVHASARSIARMSEAMQNGGRVTGLRTGLRELDAKTNGFQRGDLIVIAGRPGMGKSGLTISALRQSGGNALLFSLEMGAESVADRILSDIAYSAGHRIPYFNIARGSLSNADAETIAVIQRETTALPRIEIDPQGGLSVAQMLSRARSYKARLEKRGETLDAVCVDHMHIARASSRYAGNRVNELSEISAGLKALAKEINVPVLAIAQLSRQVEQRDNKRPTLSDLRDSGAIEQDADVILFLFREAYYLQTKIDDPQKDSDRIAQLAVVENLLEVTVAKHRNGPTGTVPIFFDVACNAARNLGAA